MTAAANWALRDLVEKQQRDSATVPPRMQQMIALLLANQALICQYSYGHVELHYKDGQVQGIIKHQLLPD